VEPVRIRRGPVTETYYAACRYFAAEQWDFAEPASAATSREHFDLLIVLEGGGSIHWDAERAEYAPAQVWLIPAALGDYRLAPAARTSLLRAYVPGDLNALGRRLTERGVGEAEWTRLVHR
jgi:mannose-6-phosphate isomerase class I